MTFVQHGGFRYIQSGSIFSWPRLYSFAAHNVGLFFYGMTGKEKRAGRVLDGVEWSETPEVMKWNALNAASEWKSAAIPDGGELWLKYRI